MRVAALLPIMLLIACGDARQGPPGPEGPQGSEGRAGPQGPMGEPGMRSVGPTRQTFCIGTHDFGGITVAASHVRYDFPDGSAFIECYIEATNAAEQRKESLPYFFRDSAPELQTGNCFVDHELNSATGKGDGRFVFSVAPGELFGSAIYLDNGGDHVNEKIELNCEFDPPYP